MARTGLVCPACGHGSFANRYGEEEIGREAELRDWFVRSRFRYPPRAPELTDLTNFAHSEPARLLSCGRCGLTFRDEESGAADYTRDRYDCGLLEYLYPRYAEAFLKKERDYRGLLPPRAHVIEVGSHLGAFLETAERWDWSAVGLDIGKHTSEFARRMGFRVHQSSLPDAPLAACSADAVFVWNCFEQIEDPATVLARARALLKPAGLLVIRVPNAEFYERWRRRVGGRYGARAIRLLAYNNLLAFPYLYGYTPRMLVHLAWRYGFETVSGHNTTLLTTTFPELTPRIKREFSDALRHVAKARERNPDRLNQPWIELIFRRAEDTGGSGLFARSPRISPPRNRAAT